MSNKLIDMTKLGMDEKLEHFKEELRGIRAGRATPGLIEPVTAEVYGSQMRIKELATISAHESRQLLITPFDGTNAPIIAKAIDKANLGVQTAVEGKTIRVTFPELTQDRRKELINQCHDKKERCKISIRNVRRDQNEAVKKEKQDGTLTEDDVKRLEKQIQELTDTACKQADMLCQEKEKEISTI